MDSHFWFEMIGYAGSILVAISLTMKSLLRLRIINLVGALFFVLYGFLIHAFPVSFLNSLIAGIDLYYLVQMMRQKDYFTFLEEAHDSEYLRSFVDFYKSDIAEIFPHYEYAPNSTELTFFVLRNMVPAGLFIARVEGEHARILLDYVIPIYRDFQVAYFIFDENAAMFARRGIMFFMSEPGSPRHVNYLERMGFRRTGDDFVREIGLRHLQDKNF